MSLSVAEAHALALAIIRQKCARGWPRDHILTSIEGLSEDPVGCSYWMQSGEIRVCWLEDQAAPAFKISELFDEIDSPQQPLFT